MIRFAFTLILARFVAPSDFGLVAFGMAIIGFAQMLRDVGIHQAVIQKTEVSEIELSSVFWSTVFVGVMLTAIVCVLSKPIAVYQSDPDIRTILIVLSLDILIRSVYQVPDALIRRSVNFKAFAVADFIGNITSGIFAVVLAYYNFGWLALVFRVLVSSLIVLIIIFIYSSWVPTLRFSFAAIRPFLHFGIPVFAAGILNYTKNQADILIIGATASLEQLGIYQMAMSIASLVGSQCAYAISRVYYPALSRLHEHDFSQFKKSATNYISLSSSLLLIAATYLSIAGADLISILLGEKWLEASNLIGFLAWGAFFQGVAICYSTTLRASGNPKTELVGAIPAALITPPVVYAGLQIDGIYGAAVAYTISSFSSAIIMVILQRHVLPSVLQSSIITAKHLGFALGTSIIFLWMSNILSATCAVNCRLILNTAAILAAVVVYFAYWRKH